MNDEQLMRYSRHILVPEIGIEGQNALLSAHALIIGAGGLGSPIALYLAASGVGRLTICDSDRVELSNLQRQILHKTQSIGINKAISARQTLAELNSEVNVTAISHRVTGEELSTLVKHANIVLDASDNFETRHAVNRACVAQKKPLVSGAAVELGGQVSVFDLRDPRAPCYNCLFAEQAIDEDRRCASHGIFAPLVGIIGTIQATEALKILMDLGETLNGKLLMIDSSKSSWQWANVIKDPACTVCSKIKSNG